MTEERDMRPLAELVADPANVREHDEKNRAAIRASLVEHGQVEPLVVQKSTMIVIGGNERLSVMTDLGWTEAWCNVLDISNTARTRLGLMLNRSGELARWKEKALLDLLGAMEADGEDITGLGWDEEDVGRLADKLKEDDSPGGGEDPFADVPDANDDVRFGFGDYSGLVSRRVYDTFVTTYRERQQADGTVMLDDVLREWLGV